MISRGGCPLISLRDWKPGKAGSGQSHSVRLLHTLWGLSLSRIHGSNCFCSLKTNLAFTLEVALAVHLPLLYTVLPWPWPRPLPWLTARGWNSEPGLVWNQTRYFLFLIKVTHLWTGDLDNRKGRELGIAMIGKLFPKVGGIFQRWTKKVLRGILPVCSLKRRDFEGASEW